MKNPPILSYSETLLLMAIKHNPTKDFHKNEKDIFLFYPNKEEAILNDYPMFLYAFKKSINIPCDTIFLENINMILMNIVDKINPKIYRRTLENLSKKNEELSLNQKIFLSLYGELQAVQVYKEDKTPLFILDEKVMQEIK